MSTIMTASNQWAKRPADERFVSLLGMRDAIEAARKHKLEDAQAWLANRFTAQAAQRYANAFEADEGRPMETLWDAVTGMTAAARNVTHQDARVTIEREAGKLMDMAARAA